DEEPATGLRAQAGSAAERSAAKEDHAVRERDHQEPRWRARLLRLVAEHAFGLDALGGALQRLGDQLAAVVDPVERDEAAHARALRGAEQGVGERVEPGAEGFERVALADLEDLRLDILSGGIGGQLRQL